MIVIEEEAMKTDITERYDPSSTFVRIFVRICCSTDLFTASNGRWVAFLHCVPSVKEFYSLTCERLVGPKRTIHRWQKTSHWMKFTHSRYIQHENDISGEFTLNTKLRPPSTDLCGISTSRAGFSNICHLSMWNRKYHGPHEIDLAIFRY